jgi:hypothetical protein
MQETPSDASNANKTFPKRIKLLSNTKKLLLLFLFLYLQPLLSDAIAIDNDVIGVYQQKLQN